MALQPSAHASKSAVRFINFRPVTVEDLIGGTGVPSEARLRCASGIDPGGRDRNQVPTVARRPSLAHWQFFEGYGALQPVEGDGPLRRPPGSQTGVLNRRCWLDPAAYELPATVFESEDAIADLLIR